MNTLVFDSLFNDESIIDKESTNKPGYVWYPQAPWNKPTSPSRDFTIRADESGPYLHLAPSINNGANWNLSTMSPVSGAGRSFTHGYFEARMRFVAPDGRSKGFPAFWGESKDDTIRSNPGRSAELDFFEALAGGHTFAGNIHDMNGPINDFHNSNSQYDLRNSNSPYLANVNFSEWHTFGCAWTLPVNGSPNSRVSWYLDNEWLMTQSYGSEGPWPRPLKGKPGDDWVLEPSPPQDTFTILDQSELVIVLGAGLESPMDVQWVRVWQA